MFFKKGRVARFSLSGERKSLAPRFRAGHAPNAFRHQHDAPFIKFYELWEKRPRLYVTRHLTGYPEIGNTITIENPSDYPFIINYWELVWKNDLKFWQKDEPCVSPDLDFGFRNFTIKPHTSHSIPFMEENHFEWGASTIDKGKLYIKLRISGRKKPLQLLVYNPSQINIT